MPVTHAIAYNPPPRVIVVYFGLVPFVLAAGAVSIFRPIVAIVFAALCLLLAILLLLRRFVWPRQLTISDDSITVPCGFLRLRPVAVPFAKITHVSVIRL